MGIMNGNGNVVKIIISILIVLLIVLGAVGVAISVKDNEQHRAEIAEKEARAEALRLELDPLKRERQELESELARLEASYAEGAGALPAFAVIFRDMSAEVYESAFPELTDYGYTASVAVDDPATIGTAGMLDVSMLLRLSAAGWSFCAAWDGTGDGAAHFESVKKSMADMGITLYPAVLYTGTTLGEADAAALAAAGVDEIVLPETAHTSGTVGDNVTRSAEWDREGGNLEILSGISSHKDVLFTASGRGLNLSLFRSMLDMLKMYEAEITVKSLDARQTYRENAEKDRARLEAELAGRVSEIRGRIAEIKDEINALYTRYGEEMRAE